ncbi:Ribulose bisphosphate carboxylase small chain chloroplastic [Bienertia sinuspersici]
MDVLVRVKACVKYKKVLFMFKQVSIIPL